MNDRELRRLDAGIRMKQFRLANTRAIDVNQEAKAAFDMIDDAVENLEPIAAAQTSGEGKMRTTVQAVCLEAVIDDVRKIARTAKGLAVRNPGLKELFPFPDHWTIQETIANARQIAVHAETHKAKLISFGMPADVVEKLIQDIIELEEAVNEKAGARNESVGATADVGAEFEKLMEAREILMGIVPNIFANNPGKLAEWKSASHIQRLPAGGGANNNQNS